MWFGNRLSVNLSVEVPEKVVISKARVPEFKRWIPVSAEVPPGRPLRYLECFLLPPGRRGMKDGEETVRKNRKR